MKASNKGFTLIELLAVIVILAVIALIATPLIMGTITKAKKNSAKDSAYGYMKAVEQAIGEAQVDDPNGAFDISGKTLKVATKDSQKGKSVQLGTKSSSGAWTAISPAVSIDVNYKGSEPEDGGLLEYDENGRVKAGTLKISGYTITIENDIAISVS
ncbi:MAG: type II secretion system protein [Firmicutes bacterium]|nr:type II secretion system protein [Bacillota bacterium]